MPLIHSRLMSVSSLISVCCCSMLYSSSEAATTIDRIDLSGQDVANLLGVTASKFSFALPKSSGITCWVDSYDRGVVKPEEVIKVDVPSASKKCDVVLSLGHLGDPSAETIQVYLSVVAGGHGTTTKRATVENFLRGMGRGGAWEEVNVEYGKDIVLWKVAGASEGFSINSRDTLEELINKSDKTLILKIRFSEK